MSEVGPFRSQRFIVFSQVASIDDYLSNTTFFLYVKKHKLRSSETGCKHSA